MTAEAARDYRACLATKANATTAGTASLLEGRRPERCDRDRRSIVGVDVGGTFTDLFLYDEAERSFRTAKVPSQRGDEAVGLHRTA